MSGDPREYNRPARATLADADIGGVANGLLMLTRELWVLSDRLEIMEAVLEKRGIDIREAVDSFQPDADLQARLDEKGARLVRNVLNAIADIEEPAAQGNERPRDS